MGFLLSFIFVFMHSVTNGQHRKNPYPDFKGNRLSEVLSNPDWEELLRAEGDLNGNKNDDLVLVLESKDPLPEQRGDGRRESHSKGRIILILVEKEGEHIVLEQNNTFIARAHEGRKLSHIEPELSITEGHLMIFYQYIRGYSSYIFRYLEGAMHLVQAKTVGIAGGTFYSDHFDFNKKTIQSEQGGIDSDSTKTEVIPIKYKGMKKLSKLDAMYSWEVSKDKFV